MVVGAPVYVPETGLGEGNGHAGLLRLMEAGALAQLAAELLAASEAGYAQALLSWEGMSSLWFDRRHIRRLLGALGGFQVHVLGYLREQAEVIQSGHLQRVKRNMTLLDIAAIEHPRTLRERVGALAALRNPKDGVIALVDVTQSVIGVEGQATRYFLSEHAVASIRRHYRRSNFKLARHFMGSDAYPFEVLSPCWRGKPSAAIEAGRAAPAKWAACSRPR